METLDELHKVLSGIVPESLDDRILGALTDGGGAQDALKTEHPTRAVQLRKVREVPRPFLEESHVIVLTNGCESDHALHLLAGVLDLTDLDLVLLDFVLLDLVLADPVFLVGTFLATGLPHAPHPVQPPLQVVGRLLAVLTINPQRASTSASSLGTGYLSPKAISSYPQPHMKSTHICLYFRSEIEVKWSYPSITKYLSE